MHPAASIILFTTLSGAGYGLLFLLGVAAPFGLLPADPWFGAIALGKALGLVALGLLSSTLHLRHPERAWRAISQWRSSWLSREGLAALLTFVPALVLAWGWVVEQRHDGIFAVAGGLTAAGSIVTVYCTAQIYASLKPIRQWRHPLVALLYLLFALAVGATLLVLLLLFWGGRVQEFAFVAGFATAAVWLLKLRYWRDIDGGRAIATPESATGLGHLGKVRMLEPPHTEENYLLKEMGYRVARKHAERLRRIAAGIGLLVPLLALIVILATAGWWELPLAILAAIAALLGTLIERWLFFAEATHTVVLYYGRQA
jgi:DMSO reductase anchor subunit